MAIPPITTAAIEFSEYAMPERYSTGRGQHEQAHSREANEKAREQVRQEPDPPHPDA